MNARYERDVALRRLRSVNTGTAFAGIAAIGLMAAGVAVAVPGHAAASAPHGTTAQQGGDDAGSNSVTTNVQPPSGVSNTNNQPPAATSGGS